MITGLTINTDGTIEPFTAENNHLRALQKAVGGYVEVQRCAGLTLWFNEDGKIKGLPINTTATQLWWRLNPTFWGQDHIAGPVVVTGTVSVDGEELSLDEDVAHEVRRVCNELTGTG